MDVTITTQAVDVSRWAEAGPLTQQQRGAIWCPSPVLQRRVELALIEYGIDLDHIEVLTPFGFAASRSARRVMSSNERRRFLAAFLSEQHDQLGPTLQQLLTDPSGVDHIAGALDAARIAAAGRDEIAVHAEASQHLAWAELSLIVDAYSARLRLSEVNDSVGCLTDVAMTLRHEAATTTWWSQFPHLLVLQVDRYDAASVRMLTSLIGAGSTRTGHESATTTATLHGQRDAPTVGGRWINRLASLYPSAGLVEVPDWRQRAELVQVTHPAMEAEAVVGELVRAHHDLPWHALYVVAPGRRSRLRAVARSARRALIPLNGAPPARLDGPIVDLIANVAQAAIDEPELGPERFISAQIARLMPDLAQRDDDVIDLVLGLWRHAEQHDHLSLGDWISLLEQSPSAPTPPGRGPADAVTLTTLDELPDLLGETPHASIIVVGCVEGELPLRSRVDVFDTSVLDGPQDEGNRMAAHLAAQRWMLESVARVADRVVLLAAPEPGVLISRFAEGMTRRSPLWPSREIDPTRWNPALTTTTNERPLVKDDQSLDLSATQLTMFENCAWQHTIQYRLGLRTQGGVSARFGSYVHDVLESFLAPLAFASIDRSESHTDESRPNETGPNETGSDETIVHTLDGLLALAERRWSDDIIDYASQADDFHRRAIDQFTTWWETEGERLVTADEVAFVEYPFDIPIGRHRLKGFIDRVDRRASGDVAIIDYKTGAPKTAAQVNDDLQLAAYHLAAIRDPAIAALGPVGSLTLNYLRDGRSIEQPIVNGHDLVTSARIQHLIDEMFAESHEPSPFANCEYCDFHRLCDLQLPGRPVPVSMQTKAIASKATTSPVSPAGTT
jgi:RecB family exonuclease